MDDVVIYVSPDDEQVSAELLRHGTYEHAETTLFRSILRPGMVVVDVGANIGVYTVVAGRAVGEDGSVIAFEPGSSSFALLSRSVAANGHRNTVLVPKALGATTGPASLYTVPGHPALASLSSRNARSSVDCVEVEVSTLDAELEEHGFDHVDVLKLDVQGAELDVLIGANRTLSSSHPVIFFEYWPAGLRNLDREPGALLAHLEERGYVFSLVAAPGERLEAIAIERIGEEEMGADIIARPLPR